VGEFELIERIRRRAAASRSGVVLGIGDDAAVLSPAPGHQLVATTDTLNRGIHFDAATPPACLGHKALAVNLSDLAAMGATPRWALLSLSLPAEDPTWLDAFVGGFIGLAGEFGVVLVGGDTCAGELSVTVTALGEVAAGRALTRSGAAPGDLVAVSGLLGEAALALAERKAGRKAGAAQGRALDCPVPRVALGASLIGKATSCIDISDGLLADLGHVAEASGCGAEIELASLPASDALARLEPSRRWLLQLTGGDDYELCFTVSPHARDELAALSAATGLTLTVVGRMTSGTGIVCREPGGGDYAVPSAGYEHFR